MSYRDDVELLQRLEKNELEPIIYSSHGVACTDYLEVEDKLNKGNYKAF